MTPESRASAAVYACRRGHSIFVYCTGCVTDAIRAAVAEERRIGAEAAVELVRLRVNQTREVIAKHLESFGCAEWCDSEHEQSCYTEIAAAIRRGDID